MASFAKLAALSLALALLLPTAAAIYETRHRVGSSVLGACIDVRVGLDDDQQPDASVTTSTEGSCSSPPWLA